MLQSQSASFFNFHRATVHCLFLFTYDLTVFSLYEETENFSLRCHDKRPISACWDLTYSTVPAILVYPRTLPWVIKCSAVINFLDFNHFILIDDCLLGDLGYCYTLTILSLRISEGTMLQDTGNQEVSVAIILPVISLIVGFNCASRCT